MELSHLGEAAIQPLVPYIGKHFDNVDNVYDADTNPDGYYLLAVAENRIVSRVIADKIHAARPEKITEQMCAYWDVYGAKPFRDVLAKSLTRSLGLSATVQIDPDRLTVGAGCTPLIGYVSTGTIGTNFSHRSEIPPGIGQC
eukprot:PhM_4_TR14196/c1_g4_i2/m.27972